MNRKGMFLIENQKNKIMEKVTLLLLNQHLEQRGVIDKKTKEMMDREIEKLSI